MTEKEDVKRIVMEVLRVVRPNIIDIDIDWDESFGCGVCTNMTGNPTGLKANGVNLIYSRCETQRINLCSIGKAQIIEDILIHAFVKGERL